MTLVEPIPDLQWGKGSWQDYISNWRTRDTNWMQERLILRYQTPALRTTDWGATPKAGQVTYNDTTQTLEMWRAGTTNTWVRSLMFQYLVSNKDDAVGVNISHSGAASFKGINFGPTSLLVDQPTNFLSGVALIDATGLSLKVGTRTAKLSTDATNLISDTPISAPSLITPGSGAATIGGALTAASLTAPTATITNITMSGTLGGGGIVNAASGTIGAIGLSGGVATIAAGSASANAAGIQAGQGYFYGDATSAVMRQRTNAASAAGAAFVQAAATVVTLSGTTVGLAGQPQVAANRSMQYLTNAATSIQNGGPVIVQTTDPGVANVPEGTIWINA